MVWLGHYGWSACDSAIVTSTEPRIDKSKGGCELIVGWRRHLLDGKTLNCSRFRLVIAREYLHKWPTGCMAKKWVVYFWCCCSLSGHITISLLFAVSVLTRQICTRVGLRSFWCLRWYSSLRALVMLSYFQRPQKYKRLWRARVYWYRCPGVCTFRLLTWDFLQSSNRWGLTRSWNTLCDIWGNA